MFEKCYILSMISADAIQFRHATIDDSLFIARGFQTAMLMEGVPEEQTHIFAEKICSRKDVLYSWNNTVIATTNGESVGMLTQYDGQFYHEMRIKTMALIAKYYGTEFHNMEDETQAGEYYIDSLAVVEKYRHLGIGRALLQNAIKKGLDMGLNITIAVDPANKRAQKLYSSLGFKKHSDIFIFGHTYYKLIISY